VIPFDRGATATALRVLDVSGCRRSEGPSGGGHVSISFARDGSVSKALVDLPPFAGTDVGTCVEHIVMGARIPAWNFGGTGTPPTIQVGWSFSIVPDGQAAKSN
jgi:hypothetical protein